MPVLFLRKAIYSRTTYSRRSGYKVQLETSTRIVLRKPNRGLLLGGLVFSAGGLGLLVLTLSEGWHRTEGAAGVAAVVFALLVGGFGGLIIWASRTQRDRVVVDRGADTLRIEKAKKRRRAGEPAFRVTERSLNEVRRVELRPFVGPPGSVELRVMFEGGDSVRLDHATDADHLADLGRRLALVAGVELEHRH